MADLALDVKNGLAAAPVPWPATVTITPTLHVNDNYVPAKGEAQLLVADDGGPTWHAGPWPWQEQPDGYAAPFRARAARRPLLRLTAFALGRDDARSTVQSAADWVCDNKGAVGISRVDDVSDPLITRDRATGAYLASVTMPVIVRQA